MNNEPLCFDDWRVWQKDASVCPACNSNQVKTISIPVDGDNLFAQRQECQVCPTVGRTEFC